VQGGADRARALGQLFESVLTPLDIYEQGQQELLAALARYDGQKDDPAEFSGACARPRAGTRRRAVLLVGYRRACSAAAAAALCFQYLDLESDRLSCIRDGIVLNLVRERTAAVGPATKRAGG